MSTPASRGRQSSASAALFTGAGLSHAAPASLPLAPTFHRLVDRTCYAAAVRLAPGLLRLDALEAVLNGPWNLLARLESTRPGAGAGALGCLRPAVPNEAHLLAALHLAYGGLHITVNVDDGVELAYALLSGETELPSEAPDACRGALPAWRSCFPRTAPTLQVLSAPGSFAAAALAERPLLVKLHGSFGRSRDGVVLPLRPVADDVDVIELGRDRRVALAALAAEPFVVVTGYSGSDLASYSALESFLTPGRFSWVAPIVRADVRSTLNAIDPGQPVAGRAVDVIRDLLPVEPPRWPAQRPRGPGFEERFAAWVAALPLEAAAEAFAWALSDAGRDEEAIALLQRLSRDAGSWSTRVRLADALDRQGEPGDGAVAARTYLHAAIRGTVRRSRSAPLLPRAGTAVGILLPQIERRLSGVLTSRSRRLLLRAVADLAAWQASRDLARTAHVPSGRRRAVLQRQAVELAAIGTLLRGRPAAMGALGSLQSLGRTFEHLADPSGQADVVATQALVWLAAGRPSHAVRLFQEASRLQPASVGVRATVRDLLDSVGDRSEPDRSNNRRDRSSGLSGGRPGRTTRADGRERSVALEAFVRALPKVELHVHLEGSVAPSTLATLARRHGDRRVPWTADGVRRWYRFRGYTDFLNAYVLVCDQLRTAEDFARVTAELGETLSRQNVRYAEVTFSPVAHVRRGISPGDLFAGLEQGRRAAESDNGIRLRWCAASGTRRGPAAALETVEMVLTHRPAGLVSVGLAGLESAEPRARFAPAFALAAEAGLRRVAHAGEAAGPESVWEAIEVLGAERIGHGIRSLEDPALVARLRATGTPLEVCPTSNVRTGLVSSFRAHPFPRLRAEGLVVNLNTDDPAMFHTDLNGEYLNVARAFRLDAPALAELARTGVRSAFVARADADALIAAIDSIALPDDLTSRAAYGDRAQTRREVTHLVAGRSPATATRSRPAGRVEPVSEPNKRSER